MTTWSPSQAQLGQLALLRDRGAVSAETSVGPRAYGERHAYLNGVMLGVALYPKGLVDKVVKLAKYGEPKMTLYWITPDGLKVLERAGK